MQESPQLIEDGLECVDSEVLDTIDVSVQDKPGSRLNMDARRKIETLLEEKALRKLLDDDYGLDG